LERASRNGGALVANLPGGLATSNVEEVP